MVAHLCQLIDLSAHHFTSNLKKRTKRVKGEEIRKIEGDK